MCVCVYVCLYLTHKTLLCPEITLNISSFKDYVDLLVLIFSFRETGKWGWLRVGRTRSEGSQVRNRTHNRCRSTAAFGACATCSNHWTTQGPRSFFNIHAVCDLMNMSSSNVLSVAAIIDIFNFVVGKLLALKGQPHIWLIQFLSQNILVSW